MTFPIGAIIPEGTAEGVCHEQVPSPSSRRNLVAPDSPVDLMAVPSIFPPVRFPATATFAPDSVNDVVPSEALMSLPVILKITNNFDDFCEPSNLIAEAPPES